MAWQAMHSFRQDKSQIAGRKFERETLKRVLGFARPYRSKLIGFVVTVVFAAVVGALPPLLFRSLIDKGLPHQGSNGNLTLVTWLTVAAVILALASAFLGLYQRFYSAAIGEGLIYDLRVGLFDHVQRMPLAFFTRTQTGALLSRMNNDVIGAQQAVTNTLGTVVSNAITLGVTLAVMLGLEWRLTILTLLVLPAFIWPARRIGVKLQHATREQMQLNASMNNTATERFNVSGALLVKLFGRYNDERATFSGRAARVRDIGVRTAMYQRVLFVSLGFVAAVGTAVVYFIGGKLAIDGVISVGTVAAFVLYVSQIYQPLTMLTNARVDVLTAVVSFERVFEVLDFPIAIQDHPGAIDLIDPRGAVEFKDVWFRHPAPNTVSLSSLEEVGALASSGDQPSDWILRDVNLRIEPGEFVALVGPSGAGKTTISMLVPRIIEATEGAVLVDGHDVTQLTQSSLEHAIGVVMQDPHLFHESIRENLRYARPGASDPEIVAACQAAQIHELIVSLPDGYETIVGERGYRLSGGEKQRLAIARMLLKDPKVVILDEATSHLDAESESAIQRALAEGLAGRTAIVIAHRLSTIVGADRILVVDDGRVVEQGTHAQLMAQGGLYAELSRKQLEQPGIDAAI
ncbi:MAG: ABC transporter ATP-binding protein [Acidimicrobiia bacterium]